MVEFQRIKSFFPGIEDNEIHHLADFMADRFLKRGTVLIYEGEPDASVVFVVSGLLKGVRTMDSGAEIIECIQMAGDIFFAGKSLTEYCTADCSFQATADTLVYLMPKNIAQQFIAANPQLLLLMGNILTHNAAVHRDLHVATTDIDAKSRYTWFLETFPGAEEFMKQYEIASLLGVTPECLSNTIRSLKKESLPRPEKESTQTYLLRAICFGNFEVFDSQGVPLKFRRTRTREVLAYLIDRRGSSVSYSELIAVLYGDKPVSKSLGSQFRTLVSDLMQTLRSVGAESVILRSRSRLAIQPEKIDCDFFHYIHTGDENSPLFLGRYMHQYSWAEETAGWLATSNQLQTSQ